MCPAGPGGGAGNWCLELYDSGPQAKTRTNLQPVRVTGSLRLWPCVSAQQDQPAAQFQELEGESGIQAREQVQ